MDGEGGRGGSLDKGGTMKVDREPGEGRKEGRKGEPRMGEEVKEDGLRKMGGGQDGGQRRKGRVRVD